jgi:hypothetical protein
MMQEDAIKYHSERAMQELDLGIGSPSSAAAEAHLRLSALHMEKARRISSDVRGPRPRSDAGREADLGPSEAPEPELSS